MGKYFGKIGYYLGVCASIVLLVGAVTVLYIIQAQMLYGIFMALYWWTTPGDYHPEFQTKPVFDRFSSAYTGILLYFVQILACSYDDVSGFVRLGSLGAVFVTIFIFFMVGVGVYGTYTTTYQFGTPDQNLQTDWADKHAVRTIVLYNTTFAPLAGTLCTGYFLHTVSMPIMRCAKHPEKNTQNLCIAYILVFFAYILMGTFGYIGFIGTMF